MKQWKPCVMVAMVTLVAARTNEIVGSVLGESGSKVITQPPRQVVGTEPTSARVDDKILLESGKGTGGALNDAGSPFQDQFHHPNPPAIPGIVQCALFDLGGEGVAYHDTTPTNEGSGVLNRQTSPHNHQRTHAGEYIWHFREMEAVDLSYVKDWADLNHSNPVTPHINQLYIGWTQDGEWTNYTVNVTEPGVYRVMGLYSYLEKEVTRDATGKPVAEISFDLNGVRAAVCTLPRPTQGWHFWDYGPLATITFPKAGLQQLTFRYRKGNNWAWWLFEKLADVPESP